MAKCTSCRKEFAVPFWKFATICPECRSTQAELQTKLNQLTPVFIVTPCLVGLNALVFCIMVAAGVSIMEPDLADLIHWGAGFGPLTLGPQPWRAVTSEFVHIGIIHILFNMWCLWSLGKLAERLMGNWNFLILYLLSGTCGSLVSVWRHPQLVTAGASGAIFGVAGGMIALLGMKKAQIPGTAMKQTLKSLLIFVGYNLLYGMRGGIDNAAHVGGLLSGALLGAFLPRRGSEAATAPGVITPPETSSESQDFSKFQVAAGALACLLLGGFGYVRHVHGPGATPQEAVELDLFRLRKEDRVNVSEAAKQLRAGQVDPAIEKLKKVSVNAPDSSAVQSILGEAYIQKKQYDAAIQVLRRAIALNPNDSTAHVDLGAALVESRQYDQAIDEFHTALRLDSRNADTHSNLGVALERKGDAKGALEEIGTASTLEPGNATFKKNYKRLSQQMKN